MTVRQRIDEALLHVKDALNPFVAAQMSNVYRGAWIDRAKASLRSGEMVPSDRRGQPQFDISALVSIVITHWDDVFGQLLGKRERNLVHDLRSIRNAHGHQEEFDLERGLAALTDMEALLNAIGAGQQAERVRALKEETGRERYGVTPSEPARTPRLVPDPVATALTPWRDVMVPHADVTTRRFVNAEFAADLYQVATGRAETEYQDPTAFFARTYVTAGLRALLDTALRRLSGGAVDGVVELQTSFGGGKTHALLALYHLASGAGPETMAGIPDLLRTANVLALPDVRRAVIVGTKLMAGQPQVKSDGTVVRTLWGEIAHQLGGAEGYALISESDAAGTSPGAALNTLLDRYSPCLILIDEWVAYARQLGEGTAGVGGTFETQFTFAQALTEAVSATPGAMLVVSLPVTQDRRDGLDIEVGGPRGREALRELRNVVARKQANWQPADPAESFAIVRRRLFQDLDATRAKLRDAALDRIARFYREKAAVLPGYASDPAYKERLRECYPIHPLLFEKLYNEWGAIEGFQRTRGVLRFMAAIIYVLWQSGDKNALLLPGMLPLDDPAIQGDLVRYIGESWRAVLTRDIIGADAVAARLDGAYPATFGRVQAAQRAACAIFFATAPHNAEAGSAAPALAIDTKEIRLACGLPGDPLNAFDDATRRLADDATHINSEDHRYWFAITPNLNRRASELARNVEPHAVAATIETFLAEWQRPSERGGFHRVQIARNDTAEVPDEPETRLVLLGPAHLHVQRRADSAATAFASAITQRNGEVDRHFRNALLYLAGDHNRYDAGDDAVRRLLAWRIIWRDRERFELTTSQIRVTEEKVKAAEGEVRAALRACWHFGLVPTQQPAPGAPITLEEARLEGGESPIREFEARLLRDGLLADALGPANLRRELDAKNLWRDKAHLPLAALRDAFSRYPYLRRLRSSSVLAKSVSDGVASLAWEVETFAYAEGYDEATARYVGLRAGMPCAPEEVDLVNGVLVQSAVAKTQKDHDAANQGQTGGAPPPERAAGAEELVAAGPLFGKVDGGLREVRAVFLSVPIDDPTRLARIAAQVANDIVAPLHGVRDSRVAVRIEVSAEYSQPVPLNVIETVTRNAATHGFHVPELS